MTVVETAPGGAGPSSPPQGARRQGEEYRDDTMSGPRLLDANLGALSCEKSCIKAPVQGEAR